MLVEKVRHKEIIQDWTKVEDLPVGDTETRSFEYHVVADEETQRVVLTIKCYNAEARTVRLDPSDVQRADHPDEYLHLAERRVKQLFVNGMI